MKKDNCNRKSEESVTILHNFQYTGTGQDIIEFVYFFALNYRSAFLHRSIVITSILLHGTLLLNRTRGCCYWIIIVVIIVRGIIIVARTKAWALCGCRRGFCYGCYRSLGFLVASNLPSSSEGSSIFSVGRSSMGMKSSSGSDKIGLSSITTFLTTLGVSVSKFNSGSVFF